MIIRMIYETIPIMQAAVMYTHAIEYCESTMFSRISSPTPMMYSAKYSLTIAVMILAGTDTFNAVKIYGTEFGKIGRAHV